jgi:LDH2 family malate/lactate/ureidoglycolate dehydrogenase
MKHRSYSCKKKSNKGAIVPVEKITRFMTDTFTAVGTNHDHAVHMAQVLVMADFKGHLSHGLNRLGMYVADIEAKVVDPNAEPNILKQSDLTAYLSGNNGLGPVVGNLSMTLAISKAKATGIGFVVAAHSNHYGIGSWYTDLALKCGMLGFTFCNTVPLAAPTGAKERALGTNPISFGAPGKDGDAFVINMATTAVAVGKIELCMRSNEPIPHGWAVGPDGKSTTDAELAFQKGSLMPLGGIAHSHKGYGLMLMVKALTGILAGAQYGPFIPPRGTKGAEKNLGQCFGCINPEFFAPGYHNRMSCLMKYLRLMEPADPKRPVQVPGDWESHNMKINISQGGIVYPDNLIKWTNDFGREHGIKPMRPKQSEEIMC